MDDIIVLILTLIFIVAGVFGQMRKKPVPQQNENPDESSEDNLWDLLRGKENTVESTPYHKPAKAETERRKYVKLESKAKENFFSQRKIAPIEEIVITRKKKKKFNLKKAVIYSEILNRKYF